MNTPQVSPPMSQSRGKSASLYNRIVLPAAFVINTLALPGISEHAITNLPSVILGFIENSMDEKPFVA